MLSNWSSEGISSAVTLILATMLKPADFGLVLQHVRWHPDGLLYRAWLSLGRGIQRVAAELLMGIRDDGAGAGSMAA